MSLTSVSVFSERGYLHFLPFLRDETLATQFAAPLSYVHVVVSAYPQDTTMMSMFSEQQVRDS